MHNTENQWLHCPNLRAFKISSTLSKVKGITMANSDPHFSNIFDIAIIEHLKGDPEKMPPDEHFRFYAGICNLLPLQPPGKKKEKENHRKTNDNCSAFLTPPHIFASCIVHNAKDLEPCLIVCLQLLSFSLVCVCSLLWIIPHCWVLSEYIWYVI